MSGDTGSEPSNRSACYAYLTKTRSNVRENHRPRPTPCLRSLRIAFCEVACDPTEHINVTQVVTLSEGPYLCVGTVVEDSLDLEPTKGRLMIFKVDTGEGRPTLRLVSSTPVQGCVYAMVFKRGTLALSVNSAVGPRF
jgi:hypothetical protein